MVEWFLKSFYDNRSAQWPQRTSHRSWGPHLYSLSWEQFFCSFFHFKEMVDGKSCHGYIFLFGLIGARMMGRWDENEHECTCYESIWELLLPTYHARWQEPNAFVHLAFTLGYRKLSLTQISCNVCSLIIKILRWTPLNIFHNETLSAMFGSTYPSSIQLQDYLCNKYITLRLEKRGFGETVNVKRNSNVCWWKLNHLRKLMTLHWPMDVSMSIKYNFKHGHKSLKNAFSRHWLKPTIFVQNTHMHVPFIIFSASKLNTIASLTNSDIFGVKYLPATIMILSKITVQKGLGWNVCLGATYQT